MECFVTNTKMARDYNRGFGIIRHNVPEVAAINFFGILHNLTSDNNAIIFTKLFFVAGNLQICNGTSEH